MNPIDRKPGRNRFLQFPADKRGNAGVEFGITATALVFLFLGLVETSRYLMLHLKTQHVAVTVADLVTRDEAISEAQIDDVFNVVSHILSPFPVGAKSAVILSSMGQTSGQSAKIYWQRSGAGSLSSISEFGAGGSAIAGMPAGLALRDDQTLVTVEVFYHYEPWIFDIFSAKTIKRLAYFRPRIGALVDVDT